MARHPLKGIEHNWEGEWPEEPICKSRYSKQTSTKNYDKTICKQLLPDAERVSQQWIQTKLKEKS